MSEPYMPTTDEIIRSFAIPPHRVIEREEGESLADYLSRLSIEGNGYQLQSEAAAHRWLAEHDRQVAERAWDEADLAHYPLVFAVEQYIDNGGDEWGNLDSPFERVTGLKNPYAKGEQK